ncbi:hypothetical protein HY469_05185 [Candidatus Roizmanbacteria bacterium]|nr:hypothetical protein [Candidatus Roizmanbacteria bacterium]
METLGGTRGYIGRNGLSGIRQTERDFHVGQSDHPRLPLGSKFTTPQHTGGLSVIAQAGVGISEAQEIVDQFGDPETLIDYIDRPHRD